MKSVVFLDEDVLRRDLENRKNRSTSLPPETVFTDTEFEKAMKRFYGDLYDEYLPGALYAREMFLREEEELRRQGRDTFPIEDPESFEEEHVNFSEMPDREWFYEDEDSL